MEHNRSVLLSDVFEEVEEGLRSDKATDLWAKYSPVVYVLGFLIIAAVGFNEYRQWKSDQAKASRIMVFEAARKALESGDYAAAEDGFRQLTDEGSKLSPLAANFLARVRLEGGGDVAGSQAALSAEATGTGHPFERLALLKLAYSRSKEMSLPELEAFVADLVNGKDSFAILAQELIAAKAYESGDLARARKEFSYLRFAPDVPQGVLERAQMALSVIPVTPETESTPSDLASTKPADDEASAEEETGE